MKLSIDHNPAVVDRVSDAIATLLRDGKKPTVRNVKELAGGSFRDVGPLLKELLPQAEEALRAERAIPAPPEPVENSFRALWIAAWREADIRFDEERREQAEKVSELQAEAEEAWSTVQTLEGERDLAAERADAADRKIEELAQSVTRLEADLAARDKALAEALARLEERDTIVAALMDAKSRKRDKATAMPVPVGDSCEGPMLKFMEATTGESPVADNDAN